MHHLSIDNAVMPILPSGVFPLLSREDKGVRNMSQQFRTAVCLG